MDLYPNLVTTRSLFPSGSQASTVPRTLLRASGRVYRHKETKSERSVKVVSHHGHFHQEIPFLSIGVNKLALCFPVLESKDLQPVERLWDPL